MSARMIVEADGGSRGNPGIAAGGAVVLAEDGQTVRAECGRYLGHASNNVAEYTGLLAGLQAAFEIAPDAQIQVRMDSKLVIEQMSGRWKIKHPDMRVCADQVRELIGTRSVVFQWIPRNQNARADALANESMDAQQDFHRRFHD